MEKRAIKHNPQFMTEKEASQLSNAIRAFEKGEEQPEGRFKIIGTLPKEK